MARVAFSEQVSSHTLSAHAILLRSRVPAPRARQSRYSAVALAALTFSIAASPGLCWPNSNDLGQHAGFTASPTKSLMQIGQPDDPTIRVGLVRYYNGKQKLQLQSDSGLILRDPNTGQSLGTVSGIVTLTANQSYVYYSAAGIGSQSVRSIDVKSTGSAPVQVSTCTGLPAWHRYRGEMAVSCNSTDLVAVDIVGVEEYLYGVLGAEIGPAAPPEALKAQAVASRTYALKNRNRFAAQGFDIDDTTRSQTYLGIDGETASVAAAVDQTRGEVLTYSGHLIEAPYSTDSGGVTACDLTGQCPYLQAVTDSPGPGQPDYAYSATYHEWELDLSPADLQKLLSQDPRTHVDNFQSLSIDGTDASGRITTATVWDTDGSMKTVSGSVLREILGPDQLKSTLVTLTVRSTGDYAFRGKGWGHGLGMSQLGAAAMASPPYNHTYRDILQHYYVGAVCASEPAEAFVTAGPSLPGS